MADHNDRNSGPDDLYDEATPRSIFAATWFRAVLVLIVLGVVGAVAVPYILDAMNAPPKSTTASRPSPTGTPPSTPAPTVAQATPTPPTPAAPAAPPATPAPSPTSPSITQPTAPAVPDKPSESKETATMPPVPAAKPEAGEPTKREPKAPPARQAASGSTASKAGPKMAKATASPTGPAAGGQWFVQVGAFKDPDTASKVATKLRGDNYKVDETTRGGSAMVAAATTPPSDGDHYDVIIAGQSPAELTRRLASRGLTAEATPNGAVVRPSLPLRDAVSLSKELAVDGSKVQVRRASGAAAAPRASTASSGGAETLHRVSVGGFADRATAVATLKELEAKGYKPFLTRR